jgi:hypothetical protein
MFSVHTHSQSNQTEQVGANDCSRGHNCKDRATSSFLINTKIARRASGQSLAGQDTLRSTSTTSIRSTISILSASTMDPQLAQAGWHICPVPCLTLHIRTTLDRAERWFCSLHLMALCKALASMQHTPAPLPVHLPPAQRALPFGAFRRARRFLKCPLE